jgi:hypothetical protein
LKHFDFLEVFSGKNEGRSCFWGLKRSDLFSSYFSSSFSFLKTKNKNLFKKTFISLFFFF